MRMSEAVEADNVGLAEEEPGEAGRYQVVRGGKHYRLVRDQQQVGE